MGIEKIGSDNENTENNVAQIEKMVTEVSIVGETQNKIQSDSPESPSENMGRKPFLKIFSFKNANDSLYCMSCTGEIGADQGNRYCA